MLAAWLTVFADALIKKSDIGDGNLPTTLGSSQMDGLFNAAYAAAGIVAIIMIIIGGVRYTTSNGDSSQIQSAKNTIMYAVIGLAVVIMAAAITNFVITSIK